jgi:hypothetical protein
VIRQKAKVKSNSRIKFILLLFAFCLLPVAFASAHEPITTKVRFNKEVVRIIQRNCISCHHEGGIAMSLATYEEARPWAKAIKEEILEKRMPPWHAVKGYGEFSNAPALTQHEIDLVVNWVEGGAPKGDNKDLPPSPLYSDHWQLGKPDLILKPTNESKIEAGADEQVGVIFPTNLKEDRWIKAIDLMPGNGSIVHCATVFIERDVPGYIKGDKGKKTASSTVMFGTWMPGQKSVELPDGVAWLLPAGSRIYAKVHYANAGEAARDQSQIALYFAKSPPRKQAREVAITDAAAVVPAGGEPHRVKLTFTAEDDLEAIAIRPRSHPLVVSFQATAFRPDGTQEVMIWTRGSRFDWQPTYYFKRPVALPKGTRIEVTTYFDNSASNQNNPNNPPKQVRWSELTSDPLCALIVAASRGND